MKYQTDEKIQRSNSKYCFTCGKQILIQAEICPHCGCRQFKCNGKSKVIAALLALIFGSFGFHKFYLGQVGWGFIYLIFCWTWIPAIVGFIEALIYISTDDYEFEQVYGRQ